MSGATESSRRPAAAAGGDAVRAVIDRRAIEDFLFFECDLLDEWLLTEWAALFTLDGRYLVHCSNVSPEASPDTTLFLIGDDHMRLTERVARLYKRNAIAEHPHSKTRHFLTNVRCSPGDDGEVVAVGSMLVHRRKDNAAQFAGKVRYRLVADGATFKIREKRFMLDAPDLREMAHISIIV